jgi:hypothetical protein
MSEPHSHCQRTAGQLPLALIDFHPPQGSQCLRYQEAHMKKLIVLVCLLAGIPAIAQTAFSGTWKFNIQSGDFKGHDKFYLHDGIWHCDSCTPKLEVKADGKAHKVTGQPYFDTVTVKADNDNTVEITAERNGKPALYNKLTTSDDGKTLTAAGHFVSQGGQEGDVAFVYDRVSDVPGSTNKVSGTWQVRKMENASENVTIVKFKATDDGLSMSDETGDSYDAKFDGKDYPYKGDPGTTSVSLKKIDANTIEETDKRNGKVIGVSRMSVQRDGKTMKVAFQNKLNGQAANWTAEKQ